ncbi:two-component system sensor histidine kinase NtrB [Desulfonema magnum]|uniref:histidine kinase n=1 Tax=Desulfonema magnum TaxID=45655 RepID=A0A975BHY4_9BACT|nr:ATP-binding protein [Desulfonema magnum]QTA85686.1 Two component system histidine kinase, PAS domain-containing [Desulfonema magnum]
MPEQQMLLEKGSYDILFQQVNLGIVVLNTDFTIVDANKTYLKAVKKSKAEVVGKPCHEIIGGYNMPCTPSQTGFECPLVKTLRTGRSAHIIHEYHTSTDETRYFNIATYPIRDQNDTIVRIIELWRDITKEFSFRCEERIRRMETDMKKLIQEDRMISLGKLVASCVHEINNPIQGLLTFSHLMHTILEEGDPGKEDLEKFKKYVSLMSGELERCGQIVSGLLSFSRESPIDYAEVDINDVLNAVISLTRHKMELTDIRLETKLSSRPLVVMGDSNQLQQCFLNLIFNAIEAMPGGGELLIVSEQDNVSKNFRIEIRDTGYGISDEDLEHIFDPFFTTKEEGKGTGLGLSIVYGMVKNHEGDIQVKSRQGKGTCFVLTFPKL